LVLEVVWRSSPKEAVAFKIDIIWWLIDQKTFKTEIGEKPSVSARMGSGGVSLIER